MNQRSKPESYVPPYPAFQAHPPANMPDVVLALFAMQAREGADGSATLAAIEALLAKDAPGKPLHFDKCTFVDTSGALNVIAMPYWAKAEDQAAFWARDDVSRFAEAPMTGPVGWWCESFHAPTTSLDGNYAIADVKYGIGRHSETKEEKYHAYMGSMRDRVPDYLSGKADAEASALTRLAAAPDTLGNTIVLENLPHNLCFIRSGFAWKAATPDEQAVFMRDMMPVYSEGADYLRDNPTETNCISMRQTDEVHDDFDNGVQSNAIGWFLTLRDLERWVREHPRHLAIMRTIMDYMAAFNFQPKLNLGHEVIVVPAGQLKCIYANCHAETGFLPYFGD